MPATKLSPLKLKRQYPTHNVMLKMMFKDSLRIIRERYTYSEGLRKITHNTAWLFFDKILRMGVGLVVGVWVARYLGPEQYGLWNYAIAFTSLFGAFATLGLDNVVVRDIVKYPSRRDEILGSAFYLKLIAGIATLLLTVSVIYFIKSNERLTLYLVALSSVGFVFQSFNVIDFYFQSQVKSKFTVYANNSAFIVMAIVKIMLLLIRAPLLAFAIIGSLEIALSSIFIMIAYTYNQLSIRDWRFNVAVAKELLKDSWPLLLAGLSIMIYMRIDQVMIGSMLGDKEVGIYSAAVKISEIWYFIPMAIVGSLFPAIIESKKKSEELYYSRMQKLFNVLVWIGITVAICVTFSSTFIIHFLYGKEYADASSILTLHIWTGVAVCLGIASGSWYMTENLQRLTFYRTLNGAIANVFLNFYLIPKYGAKGAAVATVISYYFSVFSAGFYRETRRITGMMIKSFIWSKGSYDE
jgi:PST family polysaccharide transporter